MAVSGLYKRSYLSLTKEEKKEIEEYEISQRKVDILAPRKTPSILVRHCLSLFPDHYIELQAIKETSDIHALNQRFYEIINAEGCLERTVLNFINHTPAYHIIGSILLNRFSFGHHDLYLFKELPLGREYRADYVLIGSNSGGYEFILIEFEKPDGHITLKNGHLGEAFRKGYFQIEDWKSWMDAHFSTFSETILSTKNHQKDVPKEFTEYDSTRFHYVVVAGRRSDFQEKTYWTARGKIKDKIYLMHHDNLYDNCKLLEDSKTF